MRVLIVDDDNCIRGLVRALLEGEGLECHEAGDGIEGLAAARELRPDLIILDVMLPGLDGFKICRMLKYDEQYSDIPIIMVSTRSGAADKETGYYTGADLYLSKPFDHRELIQAVMQFAGTAI
jgi:DNA-binding response OmpR family regulator